MARVYFKKDLARMISRALAAGARIDGPTGVVRWDVSGNCVDPFVVQLEGRAPHAAFIDAWGKVHTIGFSPSGSEWGVLGGPQRRAARTNEYGYQKPLWLDVITACRRCGPCLKRRSAMWRKRAELELSRAKRTWFATYTLSPEEAFRLECAACVSVARSGRAWAQLDEDQQFTALALAFGKELTKYFKRVRKESGVPLRYVVVAEKHKSGVPHYHALIHEVTDARITWRVLSKQWRLGFSQFKLVSEASPTARYLCKYLSKSMLARVRASIGYGKIKDSERSEASDSRPGVSRIVAAASKTRRNAGATTTTTDDDGSRCVVTTPEIGSTDKRQ